MPKSVGAAALALAALAALAAQPVARADDSPPTRLSLRGAVEFAVAHHPSLRSARADEQAADARVSEARRAALPDAGLTAEINRSTGNAVPGAFFAAPGFPNVAGPALGQTLDGGTFQTGVSVWASWDLTASLRQNTLADAAAAAHDQAKATTVLRRLDIELAAGDALLSLAEAHAAVRAAGANVERARVLAATTKPLVEQNLRPGADLSRALAEVGVAQTQLARAEQLEEVRRAELARALGEARLRVDPDIAELLVSSPPAPAPASGAHPFVVQRDAALRRTAEVSHAIDFEYVPHVSLLGAFWMRGGGVGPTPPTTADGLLPNTPNWAAGLVATWSLLDLPEVQSRARAASADRASASANRDDAQLAVDSGRAAALARLRGAVRVAENAAPALDAARAAQLQASARYKATLAPILEVAEADRLLAQAELDDAVARLDVWRALLAAAYAAGDIDTFVARLPGHHGGG